jgi:hypothetical protein
MIGHGPATFLDAATHLEIGFYVRQGIERMRERHGFTDTPPAVLAFLKIADDLSVSGHELRTSAVIESESPQSNDLPMEVTVSQAVAERLVPWCEVHTRRKIRAGEIPIIRAKPYLLDRVKLAAISAGIPKSRGAAA